MAWEDRPPDDLFYTRPDGRIPGVGLEPSVYDRYGPRACPECLGMGYTRIDAEYGEPGFGQLKKCRRDHAEHYRMPEDAPAVQERIVQEAS